MPSTVAELEGMVESLYHLRETFYSIYPSATAEMKSQHIEKEMKAVLEKIAESIDDAVDGKQKDMFIYLRAKMLNIVTTFNPEIEEALTRHVKLYPFHLEAWNVLGECFWKKGDLINSKNCFSKSLEISKNSTGLRCLSMLYRSLPGTKEEVAAFMVQSHRLAREAVSLDINNGRNWYVLGNVYIAMYFKTDQDPNWLKQSLKAYTNAARDDNIKHDQDFHFNRAVAHNYDGNYEEALQSFDMASSCDPTWSEPKKCISNIQTFLDNCIDCISTKGKIKPRKLRDVLKTLKQSDVGLYADGITKKNGEKVVKVPLTQCMLSSLTVGPNLNKLVVGKVVCHIYAPEAVTFAFCMVEDDGPCYAVNVYNIAEGRGVKIGDSVAIPEPYVCDVDFKFHEKEYKFQWIRVDNPLLMMVNGKPMGPENRAIPVLKTVFNPEW